MGGEVDCAVLVVSGIDVFFIELSEQVTDLSKLVTVSGSGLGVEYTLKFVDTRCVVAGLTAVKEGDSVENGRCEGSRYTDVEEIFSVSVVPSSVVLTAGVPIVVVAGVAVDRNKGTTGVSAPTKAQVSFRTFQQGLTGRHTSRTPNNAVAVSIVSSVNWFPRQVACSCYSHCCLISVGPDQHSPGQYRNRSKSSHGYTIL